MENLLSKMHEKVVDFHFVSYLVHSWFGIAPCLLIKWLQEHLKCNIPVGSDCVNIRNGCSQLLHCVAALLLCVSLGAGYNCTQRY